MVFVNAGSRVCLFITAGPSTKMFAWGVGGILEDRCYERPLAGPVWTSLPSRTSERGGEGDCVKEGEGKCERERALERLRCYSPGH